MNNFVVVLGMFGLINLSLGAMQPAENWDVMAPETRQQLFGEVMSFFRKEGWETIDDQTAVRLRAVSPQLSAEIKGHREQKIRAHEDWMRSNITNEKSTLVIKKGKLIIVGPMYHYRHFEKGVKNALIDDIRDYILIPNSVIIGPSGNTLHGILKSEIKNGDDYERLLGPRVRFGLRADGSVCASNMAVVEDSSFLPSTKIGAAMSYSPCCSFNDKASWCIIESYGTEYRVIIGNTGSRSFYYANQIAYRSSNWPNILYSQDKVSQYVYCNSTRSEKSLCYLEYRFEKGGGESKCYEHHVEVGEGKSISLLGLPENLCEYLLECPIIATKKSDSLITPQPLCLVHRFIPNDKWPAEMMRYMQHHYDVVCKQDDEENYLAAEQRCLYEYSLLDLARLYQVHALLQFSCGSINTILIERSIMRRAATATIYCDIFGKPYYCTDTDQQPKLLDRNAGRNSSGVFERWARCLVPIGSLPLYNSGSYHMLYAHNKRHEALKVSASAFLNFFIRQAEQYAAKTWDNGNLGALWQFEPDGMRVRLYDLKVENDHRIGIYLIPNRTEGCITNVEYLPGQQPLFYIDGEKAAL